MILTLSVLAELSATLREELNKEQRKKYRAMLLEKTRCCYYCGKRLHRKNVTLDHIIPLSGGGSHRPENLVICCQNCNTGKGSLRVSDWLPVLERTVEHVRQLLEPVSA